MASLKQRLCCILLVLGSNCVPCRVATAFVTPDNGRTSNGKHGSATGSGLMMSSSSSPLIVISPPGGVGEVAAVKAATMGSSVKWFIVSPDENKNVITLSQETLAEIRDGGGRVELAGADVESMLLPGEDPNSAISAVSVWAGGSSAASGIICTFDGMEKDTGSSGPPVMGTMDNNDGKDSIESWKKAIKVAAKEASKSVTGGTKLAILSAGEDLEEAGEEENSGDNGEGGGFFGSLLGIGGNSVSVPANLVDALGGGSRVTKLRHGQLFGTPESSPDFSPLVGGPRKDAELCEEYTMRSVRIDPTLSLSGNAMVGTSTRTSRHSMGEAAALISMGKVSAEQGIDVCLSSQRGTDNVPLELWEGEFRRNAEMLSSTAGTAPQLFTASFSGVPSVERLADWLATKWAPAILRTYDIAAIRTGARPVYANKIADDKVEIVWQELVDFEPILVGKMILTVSDTGIVATRSAGDARNGYGTISRKPLAGENVLVRSLAEAASQAIEKGLAVKPKVKAKKEKPKPVVKPVSSIQSSGTVVEVQQPSSATGPRQAGARRSTVRDRGTRRRKKSSSSTTPPPSG